MVGGKAGGKAESAQGTGNEIGKTDDAVKAVEELLKKFKI